MNRRIVSLLMTLILIPVTLAAIPVVVTWEWTLDDPQVTTFRYQIGGEDPSKWIVVNANQTSYTVEGLDGTKSYSLYLQQSYDGVNFSGSAVATAEPLEVAAEPAVSAAPVTPVAEAPAPVAQAPKAAETAPAAQEPAKTAAPVTKAAEPAKETAPAEPAKTAQPAAKPAAQPAKTAVAKNTEPTDNVFNFTLGLFGGIDYTLSSTKVTTHSLNIASGLSLGFNNIAHFGKMSGVGLTMDVLYEPYAVDSYKNVFKSSFWSDGLKHQLGASAFVDYDLTTKQFALQFGAGAFAMYPISSDAFSTDNLLYGISARIAAEYMFNSRLYAGLEGCYRYYLGPSAVKNAQTIRANLMVGVRF